MTTDFSPGDNIAMKIPAHEYEATVAFYREILKLEELTPPSVRETPRFAFGDKILWLDREPHLSQAEIWLQIVASDIQAASSYLEQRGCQRCDEIERLPEAFNSFWITSPCNIIHLVSPADDSPPDDMTKEN